MFLNDLKMSHYDVIDEINFQIRTPGAQISQLAQFKPDQTHI
jgi:hypothetical protein